jgi:putative phage-type endonuclease
MSLEIIPCASREEWLRKREEIGGIGGSDAAAAIGMSKRKTKVQLWQEKTGRVKPKDLSGVEYVQMGVRTEGPMRELFAALHPEYGVVHRPYDIYFQRENRQLFATLDGELTDKATGEKGVLEIKKFDVQSRGDWKLWDDRVPDDYFCQVLHQLNATGYAFAWLFAILLRHDGRGEIRPYYFPREDYEDDIAELVKKENEFLQYVRFGRVPPVQLNL